MLVSVRLSSAIINTMKVDDFLKVASAKKHGPKSNAEYRIPDTYRLNLEDKAGVEPLILHGNKGVNLIYEFEDGKVLIVMSHLTDEAIRGASLFVARN